MKTYTVRSLEKFVQWLNEYSLGGSGEKLDENIHRSLEKFVEWLSEYSLGGSGEKLDENIHVYTVRSLEKFVELLSEYSSLGFFTQPGA